MDELLKPRRPGSGSVGSVVITGRRVGDADSVDTSDAYAVQFLKPVNLTQQMSSALSNAVSGCSDVAFVKVRSEHENRSFLL